MAEEQSNLSVRLHERHECAIPAVIRVAGDDGHRVRLTGSALNMEGETPVTVIDLSPGGIGLHSTVFLPKLVVLRVTIAEDAARGRPAMSAVVRVRRVIMLDHGPRYFLGTSFEERAASGDTELRAMIDHVKSLAGGAGEAGGKCA